MTSHQIGLFQVALGSIFFGLIGLFGKEAFEAGLSVGELLTLRFFIASLLLGALLFGLRPDSLRLSRRELLICFFLGATGYAIFSSLYFLSVQGVSVALAALLLYTYPFWTVLMNAALGERLRLLQMAGLASAALGLIFLLWGQMEVHSRWAIAAGIGAALSYAHYVIVSGRLLKGTSAFGSGFWIIASTTLGLLIFHRPEFAGLQDWSPSTWLNLLGLALIGTVLPLILIQAGLRRLTSTETAVLSMIEPVTAALASWLWFHEVLTEVQLLGALLVLGSLWLTQRPRQDHPSTKAPPAGSTEA